MRGLTDDNPPLPNRRFPSGLKIVAIVIISVVLMMVDSNDGRLASIRGSIAVALQPLQVIAEFPADALDYLRRYFDRSALIARNDALSEQVLLLRARLQKFAALKAENERLRALLNAARSIDDQQVLMATILSVSPSPHQHTVMLNKGGLDGVFPGQALIGAHGIIGQVVSVTPMNSRAILITDANTAVPVVINRTGLRTIAEGTGRPAQLRLPYLPKSADIRVGDLLVTSGLGGHYPAGYPVAKVTAIDRPPGSEFLNVSARPTARLQHGSEVLLVWTQNDKHQPGQPRTNRDAAKSHGAAASDDSASTGS